MVGPGGDRSVPLHRQDACTHHDDRRSGRPLAITDLSRQIEAVAVRQADIEQEQVHGSRAEDLSGRREVVRLDKRGRADFRLMRSGDDRAEQGTIGGLILHMQDESLALCRRVRHQRRYRDAPATGWPVRATREVRHGRRCPW